MATSSSEHQQSTRKAEIDRAFERKVRRARWILFFEHLWRRLWLLFAVAGLFLLFALLDLWPRLGDGAHWAVLGLFGLAGAAALVYASRSRWPSRDEAIRRIEQISGVPHRPASSYEDTLTASASNGTTRAIWRAHRDRMAALLAGLKTGRPSPRTDRYDPFALRALAVLVLVLGGAMAGPQLVDRMAGAFRFASRDALALARLDAWVTPPPYTARPPLMLADGANAVGTPSERAMTSEQRPHEVPERSVVIVRAGGLLDAKLRLEIPGDDPAKPEVIEAEDKSGGQDVQEARYELRRSLTIKVFAGSAEIASWPIDVTPDAAPKIALTGKLERTPRGSLKLSYEVEDDYGVAGAEAKLEKAKPKPSDPKPAWASAKPLTGPRPPLQRPPQLPLRLPQANTKSGEATSYLELASHPWAGMRVVMTLEAKDVAGQKGRSEPIELVLPEREFKKPLARAVIEQRRKLIDDPRYRDQVRTALAALTLGADTFIDDTKAYLGLRTVYHRLDADRSLAGMKSAIDQLWHIALRIEDGDLSDAERRLREAQDRLAKALEEGASEEEIARLMQELKQAFNDFAEQLARQGQQDGDQQDGQNQDSEQISQQELNEMLENLEDMAKNGSREEAMKMLAEMQDMMERMQSGRMNQQQARENKEIMKMIEELSSMLGEQQQLMDDTFAEERKQGSGEDGEQNPGQGGKKGQRQGQQAGKQGQKGQKGGGRSGEMGSEGEEGGELGEGQERGQQGRGRGELGERQRDLKERLAKLREQMREKRAGSPDQLGEAGEAMEGAERDLQSGELSDALEDQARALDQMRQSAQSMAEQMLSNTPGRYGQKRDSRDPLGRPQRTQGPDLGTSVKVPGEIDKQRAREILEELRRRLGEATRPPIELDYLERLERRF